MAVPALVMLHLSDMANSVCKRHGKLFCDQQSMITLTYYPWIFRDAFRFCSKSENFKIEAKNKGQKYQCRKVNFVLIGVRTDLQVNSHP